VTPLKDAAGRIGQARTRHLLAGDAEAARRLQRLAELLLEESEILEVPGPPMPPPAQRWPAETTIGWILRYDGPTRRLRELHGLPLPNRSSATPANVAP
jgi:hypothetical protein